MTVDESSSSSTSWLVIPPPPPQPLSPPTPPYPGPPPGFLAKKASWPTLTSLVRSALWTELNFSKRKFKAFTQLYRVMKCFITPDTKTAELFRPVSDLGPLGILSIVAGCGSLASVIRLRPLIVKASLALIRINRCNIYANIYKYMQSSVEL